MIVFDSSSLIAELLKNNLFIFIGGLILIIGLAVGLGLSFYAMIKYNKGILKKCIKIPLKH